VDIGEKKGWVSDDGVAHFGLKWLTNPWGQALKVFQLCPLDGLGVH
jgi:hypothetical protein